MMNDNHEKPNAFVIMPFDKEFDDVYDQLVVPALTEAGYEVNRGDDLSSLQNILRDIVKGIAFSHLIVADLTALNPNVFYELGLAHALGIPTILITQSIDAVPFDIRFYRVREYSVHFTKHQELFDYIKKKAEQHLRGEIEFGNPVSDFLPKDYVIPISERVIIPDEVMVDKAEAETVVEQANDVEEEGFLDFLMEFKGATEIIEVKMGVIAKETRNIGEKIRGHTEKIKEVTDQPGAISRLNKVMIHVAQDIHNYSDIIFAIIPEYRGAVESFGNGLSNYITWLLEQEELDKERIRKERDAIVYLMNSVSVGFEGLKSFKENVIGLKNVGISKAINRSVNQLVINLDSLSASFLEIEALAYRTLAIIDDRLEQ